MKSNNGGKKKDGKIADKFRGACPPHKIRDLDALVKQCKGDESKIQAQIMAWWEEPQVVEEEWVSAGKKKSAAVTSGGGDRGSDRGGGQFDTRGGGDKRMEKKHDPRPIIAPPRRRGDGRGMRDRGARGGGGRFDRQQPRPMPVPASSPPVETVAASASASASKPGPAPVTNVPGPKGAWGQPRATVPPPIVPATQTQAEPPAVTSTPAAEEEVNVLSHSDPTPSGLPPKSAAPSGNVWATRGSAHLIQAEKVKPVPPPPPPAPVISEPEPEAEPVYIEPEVEEVEEQEEEVLEILEPEAQQEEPEEEIQPITPSQPSGPPPELTHFMGDSVLPPSVNGANINASGWEPLEMNESMSPASVGASPLVMEPESVPEASQPELTQDLQTESSLPKVMPELPPPAVQMPVQPASQPKPSVLNMGHWDENDQDDDELDFGFGGFGTNETTEEPQEIHASPARPPPGLSMPPMPAGAMLVHELENKLENTSLNQGMPSGGLSNAPGLQSAPLQNSMGQGGTLQNPGLNRDSGLNREPLNRDSALPTTALNQNTLSEEKTETKDTPAPTTSQPQSFGEQNTNYPMNQYGYGGMGMYNMNSSNGGFAAMPPGQFPLGAPLGQQQPKQSLNQPRSGSSPALPQGGGYIQNPDNEGAGGPSQPPNMPPAVGMQGYPNPAFMYGQYNQMGHPYGMQYGYPAGQGQQFGVQGGFGYHQVMSQGGYGAPYGHDGRHHEEGRDNHHYPKGGGGGYRGHNNRNNHQQHGQYGNNYQGGNYGGGGPYGNNYQGQYGEQFQRGYGGSNDPYGMQQQGGVYPGGGYPNENEGKGKPKGPHRVQQGFHQQPVGLQGASQNESGWPSAGPSGQSWGGNWQQEN